MNKFDELKQLQKNAYCKYSKFRVSSILICNDNTVFKGVNVENAAYGDTICAERNAINAAISNGKREFKELHLLTDCDSPVDGSPCGSCRQVMSEFFDQDTKIYMYGQNGKVIKTNINELLPGNFKLNVA